MNKKNLIEKIVSIPKDFYELSNVTTCELLKKSGYVENQQTTSVEKIRNFLLENPQYINDWLQYSDDQRCIPAVLFYESKLKKGHDEVSHYSEAKGLELIQEFPDPIIACAFYILKMIEKWRLICS